MNFDTFELSIKDVESNGNIIVPCSNVKDAGKYLYTNGKLNRYFFYIAVKDIVPDPSSIRISNFNNYLIDKVSAALIALQMRNITITSISLICRSQELYIFARRIGYKPLQDICAMWIADEDYKMKLFFALLHSSYKNLENFKGVLLDIFNGNHDKTAYLPDSILVPFDKSVDLMNRGYFYMKLNVFIETIKYARYTIGIGTNESIFATNWIKRCCTHYIDLIDRAISDKNRMLYFLYPRLKSVLVDLPKINNQAFVLGPVDQIMKDLITTDFPYLTENIKDKLIAYVRQNYNKLNKDKDEFFQEVFA